MMWMKTELCAAGTHAMLHMPEGSPQCLIVMIDGHDQAEQILGSINANAAVLIVPTDDWNGDLSPWPAPAVFGNQDFGGHADVFLNRLTNKVLPTAQAALPDDLPVLLCGYSLAGLFAVWAGTQSDCFAGIAAMSPSLWFDGFVPWLRRNSGVFMPRAVSLSLGDREKRTRNPRMAAVETAVLETKTILDGIGVKTFFCMEEGNHFSDVPGRIGRGINKLLALMNIGEGI